MSVTTVRDYNLKPPCYIIVTSASMVLLLQHFGDVNLFTDLPEVGLIILFSMGSVERLSERCQWKDWRQLAK